MGEMIEFASNGGTAQGYLATPEGGRGPGVVVIQEWWGLVPHIKDVADRLAAAGFVALAPDLYHGKATTEPDEAGKLMMTLNMEQVAKDLRGAIDACAARGSADGIGVIGFCMGGGLALLAATLDGTKVKATVPFYGVIPGGGPAPDYSALGGPIQGHYASEDDFAGPPAVAQLTADVTAAGGVIEVFTYPGTQHAFFNDTRPEVYDAEASAAAWERSLAFLRAQLPG
jgi:carboxymethylenebutenolidase